VTWKVYALWTLVLLGVVLAERAWAAWTVKRMYTTGGSVERCVVETEPVLVNDGYQETQATLLVSVDAVTVKTRAPLDDSFADLGLQVDGQEFIKIDKVVDERSAVFATSYTKILEQFKKASVPGKRGQKPAASKVKLQLRFWPTWPATGTHEAFWSLEGFSKAYTEMAACP